MKVTENRYSLFHGFYSSLASLCLSQLYYLLPEINRLKIQEHHGFTWWQLFLVLIVISFAKTLALSIPWSLSLSWGLCQLDLWTFFSEEAVLSSSWKFGNLSFLELCCDLSFGNFQVIWPIEKSSNTSGLCSFFIPSIHPNAGLL